MSDHVSPSPMIGVFVREVQSQFPADQTAKLRLHEHAIKRTTALEDARRARHCALWAIKLAEDKDRSHPRWCEIKEAHQIWKDAWFGMEFGVGGVKQFGLAGPTGKRQPAHDVQIEWTVSAVTVAKAVGEEDGWEYVPWEDLLVELIAMEATTVH